jgi:hypothetical protein
MPIVVGVERRRVSTLFKRALLVCSIICIPIGIILGFFVGWGLGIIFLIAGFSSMFIAFLLEASDRHKPQQIPPPP